MSEHEYNIREIKITAMVYATRQGIVDHVRATGHLPEVIPLGGFPTAMNVLIHQRGSDPVLNEKEKLVYDAILRDRNLSGGGAILVPPNDQDPAGTDQS